MAITNLAYGEIKIISTRLVVSIPLWLVARSNDERIQDIVIRIARASG